MIKHVAVATLVALAVTSTSYAADWRDTARQCGAETAQRLGCASCSGAWPEITRCVVSRATTDISPAAAESCIREVEQADRNMPGARDRIADTIQCLSR